MLFLLVFFIFFLQALIVNLEFVFSTVDSRNSGSRNSGSRFNGLYFGPKELEILILLSI
jgi:hypothetical protein